ncbi:hypothetical protein HA49_08335 [Tatumella morbirosei]|uniref:Uncharacterized protein n=1 Tax=Tatumella morbirosei TaxID=642227 RepID=A0A095TFB5_9GAMM|nr:hypothetical protein [Tatumella morbirosei]KGD75239.1 hypothetical protein HA49_08335 [Tatumella morbirosei]
MDVLKFVIGRLLEWRNANHKLKIAAIEALTPAVSQTVLYTHELRKGAPKDTEKENQLYTLWFAASSKVSSLDKDLAQNCLEKAKYWLFPEEYSQEKILELDIQIIRMQSVLEQLKHK